MKIEDLLKNVDRRWHGDFLRFVETGEAGEQFLDYLNHNKGGQQAVEMAFSAQAQAFQGLAEELRNPPKYIEVSTEPLAAASTRMAEAVEVVLQLPPEQRNEVLQKAASVIEATLGPERQGTARSVVQNLEHALGKASG